MGAQRQVFVLDGLLVTAFALLWAGALGALAAATGQSTVLLLAMGMGVPFMFWCAMIGFVVYVHHTHVKVGWHDDKAAWAKAQPFVSTTVHLTFPLRIGALVHHIMEHTAHHVDMGIPLYRLKNAQKMLEDMLPEAGSKSFVRQQSPLGLGHAVWCARDIIGDEPFAVLLPDVLVQASPSCLAQMIAGYQEVGGNVIAVDPVPMDQVSSYGVIAHG
eukprot:gene11847-15075_t